MGALLSLPLLAVPSISTLATCCGAATTSMFCSSMLGACGKCRNSMATRIAYALILLANSILSWVMLTDWAVKKLQALTLDYVNISCNGSDCFGFVAVHRINFALGAFHFLLAVILFGVKSSRDGRAPIQNGFWGPKIVAWIGLVVVTFFIPDQFFITWGNYVALFGAIAFVLLGLVLLVDLAHTWAEYCLIKIEDDESSSVWRYLLIGSTVGMYLSSIAMTVVMYVFFAHSGCSMNQSAITLNLIFLLVVSALSVHPRVQESNTRAGLAQAAVVAVYCTYLTMSAVGMEPDDKQCNPLIRASGTRTASIVIGALITFLTVAYTTTRAATLGIALGGGGGAAKAGGYGAVASGADSEHGLSYTGQPQSRREMRTEALRAAIESGALPASALDSDSDESDDEGGPSSRRKHAHDDEKLGTQYNYTVFHVIFILATAWIATLLCTSLKGGTPDDSGRVDFVPVGRTYWYSWVKIVSAWVCYGMYAWSLLAPVVLPERFDY